MSNPLINPHSGERIIIWRGTDCPDDTSWLRYHHHTFVWPTLARKFEALDPNDKTAILLVKEKYEKIITEYMTAPPWNVTGLTFKALPLIFDTLDAIEHKIKPDQQLVLTGRDMYPFYVAAMKRKSLKKRTVLIPCMSREVSSAGPPILNAIISEAKVSLNDFWLDTGFVGSVFNRIRAALGCQLKARESNFWLVSVDNVESAYRCILRNNIYRSPVYRLEELPKYWKSGSISGWDMAYVAQDVCEEAGRFVRTVALTRTVWRGLSNNRKNQPFSGFKGPYNA